MAGHPAHPPDPIRVLRLITRLNIGGPAIQAITLSDRLTARGFRTLLAYGGLGDGEGDMGDRLPRGVEATPSPHAPAPGRAARRCARGDRGAAGLLRRHRPAIVHTHTAKAGTVGRIAAAIHNRTAGRRAPARVVHTYHGHVLDGYFSPVATQLFTSAERAGSPGSPMRSSPSRRGSRTNCWSTITSDGPSSTTSSRSASSWARCSPSTMPPAREAREVPGHSGRRACGQHGRTADGHQAARAVSRNRAAHRPPRRSAPCF